MNDYSPVTDSRRNAVLTFIPPTLLLLSGFAGISYEILYGRLLGNLLGDQFAVSASILITFLLGAGLGSAYAHRLSAWLWLIEFGIGLFGVFFALGYDALESFIYTQNLLSQGLAGKILVCSVLLIIPAFLVGCSVPLFSATLAQTSGVAQFARVYGIYNVGAALTALGLEFILIRWIGINHTLWTFALVNFFIAGCLRIALPLSRDARVPATQTANHFSLGLRSALIIASVASAIFQLYMLKLSELMFGPFRENFALVLAVILFGIAAGSFLVKRFNLGFSALMTANVVGLTILFLMLSPILRFYAFLYDAATNYHACVVILKMFVLAVLMAIPATTFGATVPALLHDEAQVAKDSGYLLFISALSNSAGFLVMVFVLHPYLDFGVQWLVIVGLSLSAWLVHERQWLRRSAHVTALMLAFIGLHQWLWNENLLYLSHTSFHSVKKLDENLSTIKKMESFKGNQDIFAINEIDGTKFFFINGYISFPLNAYHEKLVGLMSSMFAPRTDQALVLGLGSGSTASVVGLSFDATDAVEINPLVRANLYRLKEWNFDMEHNPRVNFIVDDAIHFIRSTTKTYSLILNTVTSPLYFSSSKLYTEDFFRAIKPRLRPDGIYATWVDSRIGDKGFDIIVKTLNQQFKECALFYIKNTYFLLLCGDTPLRYQQTDLAKRAPQVWDELTGKYHLLPEFVPYNLLTAKALTLLGDSSVPVNRLDFPALEYEMASLAEDGLPETKKRIAERMNIEEVRGIVAANDANWSPTSLVVEAEQTISKKYITRRWRKLVKQSSNDYAQAHDKVELDYYARVVDRAKTAENHYNYGSELLDRKRYAEALEQFERVIALDASDGNAYFSLGVCYEHLDNLTKAEEYYLRALSIDSDDQETISHLNRLYQKIRGT